MANILTGVFFVELSLVSLYLLKWLWLPKPVLSKHSVSCLCSSNLPCGLSSHAQICDPSCKAWIESCADRIFVFTDVDDVKFVINYDYPNNSEDYIHRIGRTGRSSKTGTSYAFFTQENSRQARDLVNVLKEANQIVSPELESMAARGGGGGYRGKYETT